MTDKTRRGATPCPDTLMNQAWIEQLRRRLRTEKDLGGIFPLTGPEQAALRVPLDVPVAVTPYYASLLRSLGPEHPLRRVVIPHKAELHRSPAETDDPLGEMSHEPLPDIIHTYPDRLLVLVTDRCAVYCRFCTRRRLFRGSGRRGTDWWERVMRYLARRPSIREVILSGGDPLMLSDGKLDRLLRALRSVPHVEVLRIHTRMPVVLPERITPALAELLRRHQPLWVVHHTVHPDELTPAFARACDRLADHGVPMGSQTVLLRGINDSADTLRRLFRGLVRLRIKPLYLHQCDLAPGTRHFRTPLTRGVELLRELIGTVGSPALPLFVVDPPGGGGKVPLLPDYVAGREGSAWLLRSCRGRILRYEDDTGIPLKAAARV